MDIGWKAKRKILPGARRRRLCLKLAKYTKGEMVMYSRQNNSNSNNNRLISYCLFIYALKKESPVEDCIDRPSKLSASIEYTTHN